MSFFVWNNFEGKWIEMSNEEKYMSLPLDLSGSIAKNRFKNEILWGLHRMYETYNREEDFTVVFDYMCDIEIHKKEGFEFYQIKTKNSGEGYTTKKLVAKDKVGKSILGQIYLIKCKICDENTNSYVSIVSNKPLKSEGKLYNNEIEKNFTTLEEKDVNMIKESLKSELQIEKVDLEKVLFVYSTIDLFNPDDNLIGKTSKFFLNTFGAEPIKINSLYDFLYKIISDKATCEIKFNTYDEVLKNKGFSRAQLTEVMLKHKNNSSAAIERANKYIDNEFCDNFKMRLKYKKALTDIFNKMSINKVLDNLEKDIVQNVKNKIEDMPIKIWEIANELKITLGAKFGIEYDEDEKLMFIMIILCRMEEGKYE